MLESFAQAPRCTASCCSRRCGGHGMQRRGLEEGRHGSRGVVGGESMSLREGTGKEGSGEQWLLPGGQVL